MMRKSKLKTNRRGAALIEFALCLPVMVLLVYGSIELNSSIFMKQTLTSAAHEGALAGMKQNATGQEVEDKIALILDARGVEGYQIQLITDGVDFDALESGDPFSIRVSTTKSNQFIDLSQVSIQVSSQRP